MVTPDRYVKVFGHSDFELRSNSDLESRILLSRRATAKALRKDRIPRGRAKIRSG